MKLLKLSEKLQKLKPYKNRMYKIFVTEEDFLNLKQKNIHNVTKINDFVTFEVSLFSYLFLKNKKYIYKKENRLFKKINDKKNKIIFSISIIVIVLILFLVNQIFIREIKFENNKFKDELIYQYVINNTSKIGPYYLLNKPISELSKELRQKFYNYAYVGLNKKGSKIEIELVYQFIDNNEKENKEMYGNFVSTEDALIYNINIESGNVLVNKNDIVKKGQIIVSSNLKYHEKLFSKDQFIPLKGYIIGLTNKYKTIRVQKKDVVDVLEYSHKYYNLNIFNNNFNFMKNQSFNDFEKKKTVCNIFKISFNQIDVYNNKSVIIERNLSEALEYASFILCNDFYENSISNEEKIVSLKNIKVEEKKDEYIFTFFVKCYENIALFSEY